MGLTIPQDQPYLIYHRTATMWSGQSEEEGGNLKKFLHDPEVAS